MTVHLDDQAAKFLDEIEDSALMTEVQERYATGDLEDGEFHFIAKRQPEALHYLEIGLGRDFLGLGDLRPEDLR